MRNKIMALALFILFIMPMANATNSEVCLNANTLETNTSITITGVDTTTSQQTQCPDGCSTTLSDCRQTPVTQLAMFSITLVAFIALLWVFSTLGWLGFGLQFVLIITSILMATFDIFSSSWMITIFWVFPLIVITILVRQGQHLWANPKSMKEGEEGIEENE